MIDTHTHLYDEAYDEDRDEVVLRALEAGVTLMLLPAIDSQSAARQQALYESYPTFFRTMAGLHPTSVGTGYVQELAFVREQLFGANRQQHIAVGEIGLDFYWDRTNQAEQIEVLRQQMIWAEELGLPVALHVRKAHNEFFGLMQDLGRASYRGVMHCFGGSVQEAQRAIEMGYHIGIGGVVTFKNATLAAVAAAVPLNRILLETDAPYLSPVPYRGRRNESAHLQLVAEAIAQIRGIHVEEVKAVTTYNAQRLFNVSLD